MARKKKGKQERVQAIKIRVKGRTRKDIEEAIREKLSAEPTDLFGRGNDLVLVIQHHVGGGGGRATD